jgi:hypothetical protein
MKTTVEFLNFLRGLDTLESDLIDSKRQDELANSLAALPLPRRRQVMREIRQKLLMGRINLRRR